MTIGKTLRARRLALGFSQTGLSAEMGGSISPTWISRYENDESAPARHTTLRIAEALRLDPDDVLNAFGFATQRQEDEALVRLAGLVDAPEEPRGVPVVDTHGDPTGRTVEAYIPAGETAVAVELDGKTILVSRTQRPRSGDTIVAQLRDGGMATGRFRMAGLRRFWLETPAGDIPDMTPFGVVIDA